MTENTNTSEDRREYFRIDDALRISYRVIARENVAQLAADLERGHTDENFTLMGDLNAINQQLSACMRRIEVANSDVATYLKALDKKIELLARSFFSRESELASLPARPANISGGGMAVHCREMHEFGEQLEIKVLLSSSFTGIVMYGEVVACDKTDAEPDYPYVMRIHFTHIRAVDRDALIKHVLAKQSEFLRKERERRQSVE